MAPNAPARHVLYVEDDRVHIVLMEEVFKLLPGWCLDIAESGKQALEAAAHMQPPDLLLIDMHLPDTTGAALLARWRQIHPNTPWALALSADGVADLPGQARAAGFVDFWLKPIQVHDARLLLCELSLHMDEKKPA